MAKRRRRIEQLILGVACSAAAIAWLIHKVDFSELHSAFSRLSIGWIPVLVLVYLSGFLFRGMRWRLMLRPLKPIPLRTTTAVILVGYMANNLLPARLGELVRAWAMLRAEQVNVVTSVASIGVERVFDGLALLLIFALAAGIGWQSLGGNPMVVSVGVGAAAVFVGALVAVLAARLRPNGVRGIAAWAGRWAPGGLGERIVTLTERVLDALSFLVIDRRLPVFLTLSLVIWLIEGGMYLLALSAFGLPFSPSLAYFTMAFANFGILAPSAPGYVGVFQTCVVLAFGAFGLSPEIALGYSITVHAAQFVPVTLLGLLAAWRSGFSTRPDPTDP